MKNLSPLPWIVLLTSVIFISCGSSLKEPDFKNIENVRTNQLGLKETSVQLDLRYYNPNKSNLKLKKAEGDAWVEDTHLGHFTVDTFIHIPPLSEFIIPVTLKMDMSTIIQNMSIAALSKEVKIKVDGNARVGKGMIFVNYPIKYEGRQNLAELMK